ncbi:MAG: ribonuclease P protein component 1 [archaeon]
MRSKENLHQHELIGLKVEVAESSNTALMGLKGTVADETRNMLVVDSGGMKKVPKADCTFRFPEYGVSIEGKILVARPEDRIKKRFEK